MMSSSPVHFILSRAQRARLAEFSNLVYRIAVSPGVLPWQVGTQRSALQYHREEIYQDELFHVPGKGNEAA